MRLVEQLSAGLAAKRRRGAAPVAFELINGPPARRLRAHRDLLSGLDSLLQAD